MIMMVAFLWAVAPCRCQLEIIPALNFMACEDSAECHPGTTCNDNECKIVEEGFYYHQQHQVTALKIVTVIPLLFLQPDASVSQTIVPLTEDTSAQAPPSRHFVDRTALPARAPSFVS